MTRLRRELERWRFLLSASAGSFGGANHPIELVSFGNERVVLREQSIDLDSTVSSGREDVGRG